MLAVHALALACLWKTEEDGKDPGFVVKPYGGSIHAMNNYPWDAVSLEPFDRKLTAPANAKPGTYDESDSANVQKYIDAQVKQNSDCQFYIYSRWPRMRDVDGKTVTFDPKAYLDPQQKKDALPPQLKSWQTLWDRKYTGGWDGSEESKDYFEKLTLAVRQANPTLHKPVLMVPVGQVMAVLNTKMEAGEVPGCKTIWQLYNDGIHLDHNGQYLVACTFFATLTAQDPTGLPTEPYGVKDTALAKIIQQTVWEVVTHEPLASPPKSPAK